MKTADQQSALTQWQLAYKELHGVLSSIERSRYTNVIIWQACIKMLESVNDAIERMLK